MMYHGSNREKLIKKMKNPDIILTSYAVIRQETLKCKEKGAPILFYDDSIFNKKFYRVILDEAHFIRNKGTKTTKVCVLEISRNFNIFYCLLFIFSNQLN